MDRAVSWPASRSPPSPSPHVPTPTRLRAGIPAIWSSGPTSTTSAASGACSSARATTSGPMPRGSPSVTARRGRCACGPGVLLEADVDVGLAADQIQEVLDREVLAQVGADAVFHILERELPFGKALGDFDDGELGAQPRIQAQHRLEAGRAVGRQHDRSEEHTSELQSHSDLVCRLLLEKKKKRRADHIPHTTTAISRLTTPRLATT